MGESKTLTIYAYNSGTTAATLALKTKNWNPTSAKDYITLTWDYAGQRLAVGATLKVTLTLKVASNAVEIFNFRCGITIIATA